MLNSFPVKVYTLLTLDENQVHDIIPNAVVCGPIQRWDLEEDIEAGVPVVVIIDGKFGNVPPVVPGEIMDALRAGMRIYGSSSMGALRAAEMYPFGMIGCGEIFEMIKNEEAFRDDYLGQLIITGFKKDFSLPYIDFYFNLLNLKKRGLVDQTVIEKIEVLFGQYHFSKRSSESLIHLIHKNFDSDPKVHGVLAEAATSMGSQKMRDAIELLKMVKSDLQHIADVNEHFQRELSGLRAGVFEPFWKSFLEERLNFS